MRRCIGLISLCMMMTTLQACHSETTPEENSAYVADQANEDDALNEIRENAAEAVGASEAVEGLIPDQNGHVPMANVQ